MYEHWTHLGSGGGTRRGGLRGFPPGARLHPQVRQPLQPRGYSSGVVAADRAGVHLPRPQARDPFLTDLRVGGTMRSHAGCSRFRV